MSGICFFPPTLQTVITQVNGEDIEPTEAELLINLSMGFYIENNGDEDVLCKDEGDPSTDTISDGTTVYPSYGLFGGHPIHRPPGS